MKDRNHYKPPLKTMTCIVFVYFTQGIPLPCDLAMICPEAQTGGFSYGVTHYKWELVLQLSASLALQSGLHVSVDSDCEPTPRPARSVSPIPALWSSLAFTYRSFPKTGPKVTQFGKTDESLERNSLAIWKPQSCRCRALALLRVSKETTAICASIWRSGSNSHLLSTTDSHDSFKRLLFPPWEIL